MSDLFRDAHAEDDFHDTLSRRKRRGTIARRLFRASTVVAIIALLALLYNIVSEMVGLVAVQYEVDPATLSDQPLAELPTEELVLILEENISRGLYRRYESEKPFAERSKEEVLALIDERVVGSEVVASYTAMESLLNRRAIEKEVVEKYPDAVVEWRSWLDREFVISPMSATPLLAGVRTALMGSLWMIGITILVAVPIGVGAAIYLEEYASHESFINRMIQANINNLAGVPSIIYGMLGLAIFVRALEPLTSGAMFGITGNNGRSLLAAALTMSLLILPIIIIAAQEAIRAVPSSLRLGSYGLGATKWQTIWHHVLPVALPSILTGIILAISRAIGETAPLIVVGAATYIVTDPSGPFSNFTVLPIQIYNWTSQPQDEFRHLAAAAIIVLLTVLLSMNAVAVLLRNRFQQQL